MSALTVPHLDDARRPDAMQAIAEEAVPRRSFYVLVLLSTAIASYGLLANSTAVVIGAMLIAPLMGPIYGIALGLIQNDRRLFFSAALSEAIGAVLAVGLAAAIGILPLRPDFGSEILARTQPNLYDLLVAVVAGVAGGYARVSERVSPTLPGVAIATALVPPLAMCGLCLSDARWDAAFGAFLLFVTNRLAIEISAGVVFCLAGFAATPNSTAGAAATLLRRFTIPVLLLVPIALFLLHTLVALVRDDRLSKNIRDVLAHDMQSVLGAEVSEIQHAAKDDELEVVAVILTPQSIDSALIASTEDDLRRRVDSRIHLIVRSVISRDDDRRGQVFVSEGRRRQQRIEREQRAFLDALSTGLRQGLAGVPGAQLIDVQRAGPDSARILATVRAPTAIDPRRVALMQQAAVESTKAQLQLVVRLVLTREANDRAYIGEDERTVATQQVRQALELVLGRRWPDTELLAVRANDDGTIAATLAGVLVPSGWVLEKLNQELTQSLGRETRLTLRVAKTADVTTVRRPAAKPSAEHR